MIPKDPAKIKTLIERFDPNSGNYNFTTRIIDEYTREQLIDNIRKMPASPESSNLFPARIVTENYIFLRNSKNPGEILCLVNKIGYQTRRMLPIADLSDKFPFEKKTFEQLPAEKIKDRSNPSYFDEPFALWEIFYAGASLVLISIFLWIALLGRLTNPGLFTVLISLAGCECVVIGYGVWRVIQAIRGEKLQEVKLGIPYLDDFKTWDLTPRIILVFLLGILICITALGAWVVQNVTPMPPGYQIVNVDVMLVAVQSFVYLGAFSLLLMSLDFWSNYKRIYGPEILRKKKILEMLGEEYHKAAIHERSHFLNLRKLATHKKWWSFGPFPKIFAIISVITVIIPLIVELFTK